MKCHQGIDLKICSCGLFIYLFIANACGFFIETTKNGRTHHVRKVRVHPSLEVSQRQLNKGWRQHKGELKKPF
jgi:hypothetical protein